MISFPRQDSIHCSFASQVHAGQENWTFDFALPGLAGSSTDPTMRCFFSTGLCGAPLEERGYQMHGIYEGRYNHVHVQGRNRQDLVVLRKREPWDYA